MKTLHAVKLPGEYLPQPPAAGEAARVPTPRTNRAIYNGYDYLAKEARQMERELASLSEATDTLLHVIGLTPISGNKAALQEAFDLARAALASVKL